MILPVKATTFSNLPPSLLHDKKPDSKSPLSSIHISISKSISKALKKSPKMNTLVDTLGDDITATVTHLLNFPTTRRSTTTTDQKSTTIPTDILETETNYIFYMDVPALSKSEIQVTVEEERTLVVKSNRKRKREDGEDDGCKFLRLERKGKENLVRKFRLPEDADTGRVEAKCENGVLVVTVWKNPPPPKGKSVQVKIA